MAIVRSQSVWMRSRGSDIDDRNSVTKNSGNIPWNANGPNPIDLSYHLFDPSGKVVVWDGPRTPLGSDVAPGTSVNLTLSYVAPNTAGTYTLVVDLVREGVSWFQFLGSAPFRQSIVVTSGLNAGYGATTTPQQATISATLQLSVDVTNYGQRTWTPGLFSLSYHVFSANGSTILWDGARGALPMWVEFMRTVTDVIPSGPFPVPTSIVFRDIDVTTGKLATPFCRLVIREAFLPSAVPTEPCLEHGH